MVGHGGHLNSRGAAEAGLVGVSRDRCIRALDLLGQLRALLGRERAVHLDAAVHRLVRERPHRVDALVDERVELRGVRGLRLPRREHLGARLSPRPRVQLPAPRASMRSFTAWIRSRCSGVASRSSSASSTWSVTNAAMRAGSWPPCAVVAAAAAANPVSATTPAATGDRGRRRCVFFMCVFLLRRGAPGDAAPGMGAATEARMAAGRLPGLVRELEETLTPSRRDEPRRRHRRSPSPTARRSSSTSASFAIGPAGPDRARRRERHRQVVAHEDPRRAALARRGRARLPARGARRVPAPGRRRAPRPARSWTRSSPRSPAARSSRSGSRAAEAALAAARARGGPARALRRRSRSCTTALDHFEERFGRHRAERILGGLALHARDDLDAAGAHVLGRLEDARRARRAPPPGSRTSSSSTSRRTTSTSRRSSGSTRSCAARAARSSSSRTTASS